MSQPPKITQMFLDNVNRPTATIQPQYIVVHWTANTAAGANAKANRNYFNRKAILKVDPVTRARKYYEADGKSPFRYASAHYIVDDTEIVCAIPPNEMAYHVGAVEYRHPVCRNNNSIGIEMCVNDGADFGRMEEKTVELVAHLCDTYHVPIERVIRHYDVTLKLCPKFYVDKPSAWEKFKQRVEERLMCMRTFVTVEESTQLIDLLKIQWADASTDEERRKIGRIADIIRIASGQPTQNH